MRTSLVCLPLRFCAIFVLSLVITKVSRGEDFYIAQNAIGSGSGVDAANAASVSFFNTPGNWSSPTKVAGRIGPGDTVRLVGVITTSLVVRASGTPGNVITILFEPGARMTSPAWSGGNSLTAGAIAVPQLNHITIDGGTNGLIENTDNGTNLGTKVLSTAINGTSASFFTVRNLTIRNMYVRTAGTDINPGAVGVQNTAKNGLSFSNFLVENCTISDAAIGIDSDYAGAASNYTFRNNTAFNCNWGGRCADRNAGSSINNVVISGNRFYNFTNWDGTDTASQNAFHHNGFYCWAESGGTFNSVTAYDNYIGPNFSTVNPNGATAGLFFSGAGMVGPITIYNNLFEVASTGGGPANGLIFIWPGSNCVSKIYNNTFAGPGFSIAVGYLAERGTAGSQSLEVVNNVFVGKQNLAINQRAGVTLTSHHNLFFGAPAGQQFSYSTTSSGAFVTLAQWQALGFDTDAIALDPQLDGSYVPAISSPAIDAGVNLSPLFTTDRRGVARPQGGAWDLGAHEVVQTNPVIVIQPPTSVSVATGSNASMTVVARGQAPLSYQWKKNGINLTDGGVISGATTATLSLTGVTTGDAGSYSVEVNNALGPAVVSNASVLNVGATAPTFTSQPPGSQTVTWGDNVTISAAATGVPAPGFQWRLNGVNLTNGGVVSGATSSTLTLTGVTGDFAGTYTVVADNTVPPAATSNPSVLVVNGIPVGIIAQPVSQTVLAGNSVTFQVGASGSPAPTFQWSRNGSPISGATGSTFTIPAATQADAGNYTVTVSNSVNSVTSAAATLTIGVPPPPPVINSQPTAPTVVAGRDVTIRAGTSGNTTIGWQVSSDNGQTWAAIGNDNVYSGALTNALTINDATNNLNGLMYRAIAFNAGGSVITTPVKLTVVPQVLVSPADLAITGGTILVSDNSTSVIYRVNPDLSADLYAGTENFPGSTDGSLLALLRQPGGVALDASGNLYVADTGNSLIRRITPSRVLSRIAGSELNQGFRDGTGSDAWFNMPRGIAVDSAGNLYVADTGNFVIRKITPAGVVTTLAGAAGARGSADGSGTSARFNEPSGVAVDASGTVYVTDTLNQTIRRVTATGTVTTLAGVVGIAGAADGVGTGALFNRPFGITLDTSGNLYVTDAGNSTVRRVTSNGTVTTVAGLPTVSGLEDGAGINALFNQPLGLRFDGSGNLYVVDNGNAAIRRIATNGTVTTLPITRGSTSQPNPEPTQPPVVNPIPTPQPPPSAHSGGGGGTPSMWFYCAIILAYFVRRLRAQT